jgi:nucleoside-diphosphate-sugar epimerase
MNLLLIGGSGHVGTMVLPYLKDHHDIRILDLRPPQDDTVDYIQGAAGDPEALRKAVQDMDSFIWMTLHTGPDPVTTFSITTKPT